MRLNFQLSATLIALACHASFASAQGFGPDLFGPPTVLDGVSAVHPFIFRDASGDGRPDVLAFTVDALQLFPGLPSGSFGPALPIKMGFLLPPASFELADLDLDGNPDVGLLSNGFLRTRLGLGGGDFAPMLGQTTPSGTYDYNLVLADMDGDGFPDVLLNTLVSQAGHLFGARGQGDGSFGAFGELAQGRIMTRLQAADLDVDGDVDVLDVDVVQPLFEPTAAGVVSYLNEGDGALSSGQSAAALTAWGSIGMAGDHDLDGYPDVLSWDVQTGAIVEQLGQGDGTFAAQPVMDLGVPVSRALAVDLDRDGYVDVAVAKQDPAGAPDADLLVQRLVRFDPEGAPLLLQSPPANSWLGAADVDGDGLPELAVNAGADQAGFILSYPNALGPVVDLGLGSPGGPGLTVTGIPAPGQVLHMTLQTSAPVPALLIFGTHAHPQDFGGALLVPEPLLSVGLAAPTAISATWPAGVPEGTLLYLQAFVAAGAGLAGSNAVMLVPQS